MECKCLVLHALACRFAAQQGKIFLPKNRWVGGNLFTSVLLTLEDQSDPTFQRWCADGVVYLILQWVRIVTCVLIPHGCICVGKLDRTGPGVNPGILNLPMGNGWHASVGGVFALCSPPRLPPCCYDEHILQMGKGACVNVDCVNIWSTWSAT